MHKRLFICAAFAALAACGQRQEPRGPVMQEMAAAPPPPAEGNGERAQRTLAYEHTLRMDVAEADLRAIVTQTVDACHAAAAADHCDLLESRQETGRELSADLKLRATPSGVRKLITSVSARGSVAELSTSTEDLAEPIAETDKKIKMLEAYRAKLETLAARPSNDADALIKLTHELAKVQSDLEDNGTVHAQLTRRVNTELLNIHLDTSHGVAFWRPVRLALADFGGDFANGVARAITGVAYILPWLAPLGLLVWIVRRIRRRRSIKLH